MTSNTAAVSAIVRVIGPSEPASDGQPLYTPPRLTSPALVRMPAMEFHAAGRRIDAKPSCPIATAQKFAATDAADPPEEPPTVRSRSYGFRVEPKSEPWVSPPAISPRADFPRITAPALRRRSATKESRSGK